MRLLLYILVGLLLVLPPFLIGAVHLEVQIVLSGIACIFLFVLTFYFALQKKRNRGIRIGGFFWLLSAALAFTLFQLIPLPASVIAWLSPEAHFVFQKILGGLGLYSDSSYRALSLAPGDTAVKLVRDLGVWVLFFATLQWVRRREHLRYILTISVSAATFMSFLIVLQTLLRFSQPLMGFYKPEGQVLSFLMGSPFINPNHLGGYLLLNALFALALFYEEKVFRLRILWSGSFVLMSGLLFLTFSRGAILSFLTGVVVFFLLLGRRAGQELEKGTSGSSRGDSHGSFGAWKELWRLPTVRYLFVLLFLSGGIGLHFGSDVLVKEFSTTKISIKQDKVAAIVDFSLPLIRHYSFVGVGRGAMGMALSRYLNIDSTERGQYTVTHSENIFLQFLIDWGILGILFFFFGLWLFWRLTSRAESFFESATLIALLALLTHNLGDFNLEFAGTAFPFTMALAGLQRMRLRRDSSKVFSSRWLIGVGVIGVLGLVLFAPYSLKHQFKNVSKEWKNISKQSSFEKPLFDFMKHHPSDFMLPLYVARSYSFGREWQPVKALKWIERAEFLNPAGASVYGLKGYLLGRLRMKQSAAVALGKAVRFHAGLWKGMLSVIDKYNLHKEVIRYADSPILVKVVFLRLFHSTKELRNLELLAEVLKKRFSKDRSIVQVLSSFYMKRFRLVYQKKGKEDEAKRLNDLISGLIEHSKELKGMEGFRAYTEGALFDMLNRESKAIYFYQKVIEDGKSYLWPATLSLHRIFMKQKRWRKAQAVLIQAKITFSRVRELSHLAFLNGRLEEKQRKWRRALSFYEEAFELSSSPRVILSIARISERLIKFEQAIRFYKKMLRVKGYGHLIKKIKQLEGGKFEGLHPGSFQPPTPHQ